MNRRVNRWVAVLAAAAALAISPALGQNGYSSKFESPDYAAGPLGQQQGWFVVLGTGTADVIVGDNGPSSLGEQCVELTNANGEIWLWLYFPTDLVAAGGPLVTIQYDIKNVTNQYANAGYPWSWPSTLSTSLYDADLYQPAIWPIHYDGGAGPACQAWVGHEPDGDPAGWDSVGDPPWLDTGWHTVSWVLDYQTRQFVKVTFDGMDIQHDTWFVDWNGQDMPCGVADSVDWLELGLYGDGGNDVWRIDNYAITAVSSDGWPVAPIIADIPDASIMVDLPYTGPTPTFVSGTTPVTWSLDTCPSGMTIDACSGVVSWPVPTTVASPHTVTIRATNAAGSDTESWQLTVTPQAVPSLWDGLQAYWKFDDGSGYTATDCVAGNNGALNGYGGRPDGPPGGSAAHYRSMAPMTTFESPARTYPWAGRHRR